jgi:NAD(P)-dependent dehydrogenase (short-subunit alcohol dehydrogenase family)
VAVVTGGSSGIGQGAALELARRGFGVVVTYNANPGGARQAVDDVERLGGTAVALPLDVSRADTFADFTATLRATLQERWGVDRIAALVNNAGYSDAAPFSQMTEDTFDRLSSGLLRGPFFLTQHLLPVLADGGSIVNVTSSSTAAHGLEPGYSAYGALKGALVVLTRYQAKELADRGIRANSVSPGPTRTRLGGDALTTFPELAKPLAARTALGRLGEPADVGRVIAFLASADSAWVTAQDLEVSGGFNL